MATDRSVDAGETAAPHGAEDVDVAALERALRERVAAEVRFDAGSLGAYATDASNYRQVPIGVVVPRDVAAGAAAVAVCAQFRAPVLSRGGGTSLAGQCTNAAVVIDWTKYCNQLVSVDADRELMRRAGIEADVLDAGCCGLAGNFGFERGHHDLSMAVGEQGVLPAVRAAAPHALVIADGFSCRTQIEQGDTGRCAMHLAEALALGLDGSLPSDHPEKLIDRPLRRGRS